MLDHTSKEDDGEGGEDQVIQQNKRVLVQVGGVETDGMELVLVNKCMTGIHLLNGKNQNMANTQMTFYSGCQYTWMPVVWAERTL